MRHAARWFAVIMLALAVASPPAAAETPAPLHIHLLSGSTEYKSEAMLKALKETLEKRYHVTVTMSLAKDRGKELPNVKQLQEANLLIVFTRRLELPAEQLAHVKKYLASEKPVIGLRTASHAFDNETNAVLDKQVFGGDYKGHGGDDPVKVSVPEKAKEHPVMKGVGAFDSGRMYNQGTLAKTATILQIGEDEKSKQTSPVTWVNEANGRRAFYTSLAIPGTFENEHFQRMLMNAIWWVSQRDEAKFRRAEKPATGNAKPQVVVATGKRWKSLFNGKDLTGWKPIGTAVWKVEGGVIVGGQDGDPKRAGLLATTDEFKDFELTLEFMIDEHGKYNSGVYLRNTPAPGSSGGRTGYQINIGRGVAGEYCGGLFLNDWLAKGDEKDEVRKPKEWNALRIVAKAGHIIVDLNGKNIVDYKDEKPDAKLVQKGVLAFQTYGAEGHAGWVKFREIKIRQLE